MSLCSRISIPREADEPRLRIARLLAIITVITSLACGGGGGRSPTQPGAPPLSDLERATADLTERLESPSFIFHFRPGDSVQVERSEAYHEWATGYLGVIPPKKIDYYKFPNQEAQTAAFGERFGGWAHPNEFAVVTFYSWHNHECMHLYASLIGSPPRIFGEGMAVAHEFDPYNNSWVSRWNRARPHREPHIDVVRSLKARGLLYPIDDILESEAFNARVNAETERIGYPQAGMFVAYLIDVYGLERMKEAIGTIGYSAPLGSIRTRFESIYGITVIEAETEWLDWLDEPH